MTKAAEELYVSQSSLSQYVSRLEQEIGTPLFFRAKGELTLTPAGELYVDAAKEVVKIQKRLYQNIANINQRGHISVGSTSQFGLKMLSTIIPAFKKKYPDYGIEISETNAPGLKKMLLEENIDLGIAATSVITPFEDTCDILREEEVLFAVPATHPYCQEHPSGSLTIPELIEHFSDDNFLLSKHGSSLRLLSDEVLDSYRFVPSAICETNSISTMRSMIAHQVGVAFIAESCSHDREHIRYYSLEPKMFRHNVMIRRKSWVINEPEAYFCQLVKEYFPNQPESPYLA